MLENVAFFQACHVLVEWMVPVAGARGAAAGWLCGGRGSPNPALRSVANG
jgi:hypothetical protein